LCCHGAGYAYSEFLGLLVIGTQPSANFAKFGVDKICIRNSFVVSEISLGHSKKR